MDKLANMADAVAPESRRALFYKRIQLASLLIGIAGIALPFVPFEGYTTPFTDVLLRMHITDPVWLLAAPCILLPFPITAGYVLLSANERLPRWTVITGFAFAALFVLTTFAGLTVEGEFSLGALLLIFMFLLAFAGGAWLSSRKIRQDQAVGGLVAMQCVYVVPMTYWVIFAYSWNGFQNGVWLGAIASLAYLTQIALAAKRIRYILAVVVPIAGIAWLMVSIQ